MSDSSIDSAYCVELGYDVDILEANDYYFSLPPSKRRRLHFECPDEACREAFHPEIIGVNYDKEVSIRPMHFRRNGHDQHSDECSLGLYEKTLQKMIQEKGEYEINTYRNLFLNIPDSEKIPDVFQTRREVEKNKFNHDETRNKYNKNKIETITSIKNKILHGQNKTRSLKVIVDAFENLTPKQRYIPSVTIEGITMKYGVAFKHIKFMESWHTYPHIYYGCARIEEWPDGFRAMFEQPVLKFDPDKLNLESSIFFPRQNGKIPKYHPYDALVRAEKSQELCCIYMFAKRTLVYEPLGSPGISKEWIKLEAASGETVITFNVRECR